MNWECGVTQRAFRTKPEGAKETRSTLILQFY
jgi:hypothetical protein